MIAPFVIIAAVLTARSNLQSALVEGLNIRRRRLLTVLREQGGITRVAYENLFHGG